MLSCSGIEYISVSNGLLIFLAIHCHVFEERIKNVCDFRE